MFTPFSQVGTLLDQGTQAVVHAGGALVSVGRGVVHEVTEVTQPMVHALEQPLTNVYQESRVVVGGMYHVVRGMIGILPYGLSAWLIWSFVDTYLPEEGAAVRGVVDRAAKRMRLT